MATPTVLTPMKQRRDGVFSSHLAGGRMPLTPSPSTPRTQLVQDGASESIHNSNVNLMARFTRSISKTNVRDSPKSNIASRPSPRRTDTGVSDLSLTGTGPRASSSAKNTPSRTRRTATASVQRTPKRSQGKINYNAADRFVPNRNASEAVSSSGAAVKLERHSGEQTPKRTRSSASEGSAALASGAASAFDLGRPRLSTTDTSASLSLEGLSLNDRDDDEEDQERVGESCDGVEGTDHG